MVEWCSKVTGGGGVVAYTPRTGETHTCQTSPVSGGGRSLTSCMHTHDSPPVPPPPISTHPSPPTHRCTSTPPTLWLVLPVQLKLFLQRKYLQKCKCRNANTVVQAQQHIHTYIHTYRQTDRQVHSISMSALTVSTCLAFCVSCTHTHTQ